MRASDLPAELRVQVGHDDIVGHWWYRVRGTNLSDCGYDSPLDAFECGIERLKHHPHGI